MAAVVGAGPRHRLVRGHPGEHRQAGDDGAGAPGAAAAGDLDPLARVGHLVGTADGAAAAAGSRGVRKSGQSTHSSGQPGRKLAVVAAQAQPERRRRARRQRSAAARATTPSGRVTA